MRAQVVMMPGGVTVAGESLQRGTSGETAWQTGDSACSKLKHFPPTVAAGDERCGISHAMQLHYRLLVRVPPTFGSGNLT